MANEAWIIDAVRSPRGIGKKDKGALSHIHPQKVLGQVLNGLVERVGFDPADVEDVVCGNGSHAGDHAHDIGRMSVLEAGWPITVPGTSSWPSESTSGRKTPADGLTTTRSVAKRSRRTSTGWRPSASR